MLQLRLLEEIVEFSNIVIDPGILKEIFEGHRVRVLLKTIKVFSSTMREYLMSDSNLNQNC